MELDTIALAALAPTALGVLFALPFWLKGRIILGNVLASLLIMGALIVLIMQGYGNFVGATGAAASPAAAPDLNDLFLQLLGFVMIGWLDVLAVLVIGGVVEARVRRKGWKRDWM